MAVLQILKYPDPFLRKKAKPVSKFDEELKKISEDLFETMKSASGIGLAATQVGIDLRIFVMDVPMDSEDESNSKQENPETSHPITIVNPEILSGKAKLTMEEGCLSIPDTREEVTRPKFIKVRFQDLNGNVLEREFKKLESSCFQHETDHLDGKLFIDRISPLKRELIQKRFKTLNDPNKN